KSSARALTDNHAGYQVRTPSTPYGLRRWNSSLSSRITVPSGSASSSAGSVMTRTGGRQPALITARAGSETNGSLYRPIDPWRMWASSAWDDRSGMGVSVLGGVQDGDVIAVGQVNHLFRAECAVSADRLPPAGADALVHVTPELDDGAAWESIEGCDGVGVVAFVLRG